MINIEFNSEDLLKALQALDDGLQGKIIRKALTPAVKPIRDAMISLVRHDSGALKRAIGIRTLSASGKARLGVEPGAVAILLGPNKKTADAKGVKRSQGYKAIWEEFGTKGTTSHSGFPFMSMALAQAENGMQTRFFDGLQKEINKIV